MASVVVPTVPRVSPAPSAATTTLGIGADGGKTLSAGAYHTCALLDSGAVKCWGQGGAGQLGLGDFAERGGANGRGDALPAVDLGTGRKAIAVTAGGLHTCALLDTGAVKCWGRGAEGQLGLGSVKPRGGGANEMGDALPAVDLGTGRKAIAVSAGTNHTCALLDTGAVKCWGQGDYGQLGLGDRKNRGGGPAEMGDALAAVDLGTGRKAIAVSAGGLHTCAVLDTGAVKCWGKGLFGRLGLGDAKSRGNAPTEMGDALPAVDLGAGQTAIAVSAGGFHTCALLRGGAVKCWGEEDTGRLGLGARKSRGTGPTEMGGRARRRPRALPPAAGARSVRRRG
jgi:alpha-tubulin suppressor-like RCC1 family protein